MGSGTGEFTLGCFRESNQLNLGAGFSEASGGRPAGLFTATNTARSGPIALCAWRGMCRIYCISTCFIESGNRSSGGSLTLNNSKRGRIPPTGYLTISSLRC